MAREGKAGGRRGGEEREEGEMEGEGGEWSAPNMRPGSAYVTGWPKNCTLANFHFYISPGSVATQVR